MLTVGGFAAQEIPRKNHEAELINQHKLLEVSKEIVEIDTLILKQMKIQTEILKDIQLIAHVDLN